MNCIRNKRAFTILLMSFLINSFISHCSYVDCYETAKEYVTWDEYGVRYELIDSREGTFNWLFFPGGPGADSHYFLPLIKVLQLPGKTWLIDLPGNGTNAQPVTSFDVWFELIPTIVKKFENPVYVGHSFGGMLGLLYREFETILRGLIIIASAPKYDRQEIEKIRNEKGIVVAPEAGKEFAANPNEITFRKVLYANAPNHFPPSSLAQGRDLFEKIPFNFQALLWGNQKIRDYQVKWIPQHVPTLIIGGSEDCINPFSLFKSDERFKRGNIEIVELQGSGHFPWFEKASYIKALIEPFVIKIMC